MRLLVLMASQLTCLYHIHHSRLRSWTPKLLQLTLCMHPSSPPRAILWHILLLPCILFSKHQ